MHFARNLIQGGAAGLLGGSLLGLGEASWLLLSAGAPDRLAPFYAVVLYGLMALPLGVATGVAVSLLEAALRSERLQRGVRRSLQISEARAWGMGLAGSVSPFAAFILYYNLNKVLYAEQGVPLGGLALILGLVVGFALFAVFVLPILLRGPLGLVLRGVGLLGGWGSLLLSTGLLALLPHGEDPRAFGTGRPVPEGMEARPDVLFIMVDALRADFVGAYGLRDIATPAMDGLAADGVLFENAYANASWTRSSTASMWTSRIPSGHNGDTKAARLPDEVVTWAEVLRARGVVTGALVNNINITSTFNFDQGFDAFVYEAPAYRFGATESVFGLSLYKVVHKLSERLLPGDMVVERYYQPAHVVHEDAKAFISANGDARFALYLHAMEVHDPYFSHPSVRGDGPDYDGEGYGRAEHEHPDPADTERLKQLYRDEVVFYDRELGAFLDWLKAEGRYDEMMIVLTADHGEEFNEHGGFWHGTTLYQEQLHVPLIVKLPRGARAGTRVPWQVRLLDLPPTFTAAMGVAPDPSWEGQDLIADLASLDVVPEEVAVEEPAEEVAVEEPADAVAAVAEEAAAPPPVLTPAQCEAERTHPLDRPLIAEEDFEGNVLTAIQRGGFKFIRANEGNPRGLDPRELFDHLGDPTERHEVLAAGTATCGAFPDSRAAGLEAELDAYVAIQAGTAADGGEATMSAAECENLKALGYLSADAPCGH
ncbi:MAG: sulfatase [Deltaproteobacteria bacterium]|nr:sulfatase [Deltaproteobacteria bacterium]